MNVTIFTIKEEKIFLTIQESLVGINLSFLVQFQSQWVNFGDIDPVDVPQNHHFRGYWEILGESEMT